MSEHIPKNSETKKLSKEEKERALFRARFMPQENITTEEKKVLDSYKNELDEENREEERLKKEQDKSKIEKLAVSELEEPLKKIILQIKERVESGDYCIVVGDDASGRIPALILGRFIQNISKSAGKKVPKIVFIPGKIWQKQSWEEYPDDPMDDIPGAYYINSSDDIDEFGRELQSILDKNLIKYGAQKSKRILIVTELVQRGGALAYTHLLKDLGYTVDIASIALDNGGYRTTAVRDQNLGDIEIIYGDSLRDIEWDEHQAPAVYNRKELSGIEKNGAIDNTEVIKRENSAVQEKINNVREDAYKLSQKLEQWYKTANKEDTDEE